MILDDQNILGKSVLAISPHPDDVEIGCFGTLARLASQGFSVNILLLSKGGLKEGDRVNEAKDSASLINASLFIEDLEDGNISGDYKTVDIIKNYIEKTNPSILFSPPLNDAHQDHRNVAQAVIASVKNVNEIYFYETPKSFDFSPKIYLDISNFIDIKINAILHHKSQVKSEKVIRDAVNSASKYHGYKINQPGKFFEAFDVFRIIY